MWLSENGFAKEKINNGHKAAVEVGLEKKSAILCIWRRKASIFMARA